MALQAKQEQLSAAKAKQQQQQQHGPQGPRTPPRGPDGRPLSQADDLTYLPGLPDVDDEVCIFSAVSQCVICIHVLNQCAQSMCPVPCNCCVLF